MWDLWWDKLALGQVFSEYFGFPCNRRPTPQKKVLRIIYHYCSVRESTFLTNIL
jgi:hypothetical protein